MKLFKVLRISHIRNNYVGQFVENGQVKVIYCPTKDMIADILTKQLPSDRFHALRAMLMNEGGM